MLFQLSTYNTKSSLSKSKHLQANRTEDLVRGDRDTAISVSKMANFHVSSRTLLKKERKENKRGEFSRRDGRAGRATQDPRHVASIEVGCSRSSSVSRRTSKRVAASEPSQST